MTARSKNKITPKEKKIRKNTKNKKEIHKNRGKDQEKNRIHKKKKKAGRKKPLSASGIEKVRRGRKPGRRKKSGFQRTALLLFIIVFLSGIGGSLCWYFSFEKLNIGDYVSVTYSGYNTEGTASLSLRETKESIPFLDEVELKLLSENGSLQNGDSLEIRFLYDAEAAKEQKLRIESDHCHIEVSGLPEGKALSTDDLFQGVQISYEGTAPELSVAVTNESTDPFLATVSYEIVEAKPFYDVGDTFCVKADFSQEEAVRNEYIVPDPEGGYVKEYTVENRDRYVRDTAELSPDIIHTLNETASSYFGDATEYGLRIFSEANLMPIWINGKTTFVWSNPRLLSAYLNVLKPEYFGTTQSHDNDVKLVYKVTLSQADGIACDAQVVVQFNDLMKRSDGTYDLSLDSGRIIAASYKNSHIKDLVNDTYAQEYEAKKIDLS